MLTYCYYSMNYLFTIKSESYLVYANLFGNVFGTNQPLRKNYENFNLNHRINIQGAWSHEGLGNFTIWTHSWIG